MMPDRPSEPATDRRTRLPFHSAGRHLAGRAPAAAAAAAYLATAPPPPPPRLLLEVITASKC